jgi:broad specificity phosphatase PhoE
VADTRLRGHAKDFAPLTTQGIREAEAAADSLASVDADQLLTSPMTRAMHTAMTIQHRTSLRPRVELDLREWAPSTEQRWTTAAEVTLLAQDMWSCAGEWPPGETREWEPISAVRRRALDVLLRFRGRRPIIVITHGAVIESILGRIVRTGEVCRWDWSPDWRRRWPDAADHPAASTDD